ncbi:MAG: tripartite tricarboxylate transporter substrate binding protein [Alphaproteobacteria bacterium]|nr:tripartite tricarboxylate transporter substrate binding protein [Alphaproteobacteria bacterium]
MSVLLNRRALIGATAALPFARIAAADARPISYVVPFTPGATNDNSARIVASRLAEALVTSVIVDNKAGGGGSIGADFVAKAAADGRTLLNASTGNLTIVPQLIQTGYDPFRDFTPLALIGESRSVFAVYPALPVSTLGELIDYARKHPGELNFGSAGNGSGGHLAGEYLKLRTGIDIQHVPYRGSAPAAQDLIAGRIHLMIDPIAATYVRSGRLRGLAVAGNDLRDDLPGVPSIAEAGLPDWEVQGGFVAVAPAATPGPMLARLYTAFARVLTDEATVRQLNSIGLAPRLLSSEQILARLRHESETNGRIIGQAKISV